MAGSAGHLLALLSVHQHLQRVARQLLTLHKLDIGDLYLRVAGVGVVRLLAVVGEHSSEPLLLELLLLGQGGLLCELLDQVSVSLLRVRKGTTLYGDWKKGCRRCSLRLLYISSY